jgi:hypothetical protein
MTYGDKLKNPKWQKKRLKKLEEQDFTCEACDTKDDTLHVHHLKYKVGAEPWEYENSELAVLCEGCHKLVHDHKLQPYHIRIINRYPRMHFGSCTFAEILDTVLYVETEAMATFSQSDKECGICAEELLRDVKAMAAHKEL